VRPTRADWSVSAPLRLAVGIEDTFVADERPGRRKLDEYELTQHYQFWEQDLDLVADSGARWLRWGIPWYRVEPEPGRFAWDWVDAVVDRLAALDVTCIVDLMHYGTPLWLENSFLHPDYPRRVAEYAAAAAQRYVDRLHVWTPLN
jgi:beta-glucosidase